MQIGTAAPTPNELAAARHHFVKHISVDHNYNVGDFEKEAISLLQRLHQIHKVVIMVGGSGLYVNAVTKGLDDLPKADHMLREKLNQRHNTEGLEALQIELKIRDPKAYDTIAIDNPQRVIRALEVCLSSGKPYSSFLTSKEKKRNFEVISIGLTGERPTIYERINTRVDLMIAAGLSNEVKALLPKKDLNALKTVGYKELFKVLDSQWTLEFAISEIKKNTRRFAKRQLTWFKRNEQTIWFHYETDIKLIINSINKKLENA